MYETKEVMINVFLVGLICFAQPQKRKQKGDKKVWVLPNIDLDKFLKPKKRVENLLNVHCIYIF
jgi:hypothetical protein